MDELSRPQLSSITLKMSAKGDTTPELKIYHENPEIMCQAAGELYPQAVAVFKEKSLPQNHAFALSDDLAGYFRKVKVVVGEPEPEEWKEAKTQAAKIVKQKGKIPPPGADPFEDVAPRKIEVPPPARPATASKNDNELDLGDGEVFKPEDLTEEPF